MRGDVSLNHHTRQAPLILPAEFSQLNDLECYIKLPGDYPYTKVKTKYQKPILTRRSAFLLKAEKKYTNTSPVNKSPFGQELLLQNETIKEEKEV